ncbi:MAG: hypothetical protein MUO40_08940 [Anaerolineaceae bacterium]|nr:hypothetical protein [Anaerolineaceae bacterium]
MAKIVQINVIQEPGKDQEIKPIERPASPRDLVIRQMFADKEKEAVKLIHDFILSENMAGIKVVSAEYSFDGTKLVVQVNSESDPKFNAKKFHQQISQLIKDVHLEIRQVGPRDVAKALGGMGACGLEMRCCSKFLTEFNSISIRMAKSQDISLTPSEITGMCGRLRCCLLYEYEFYEDARKRLPKIKKMIETPMGEGKVIQVLPLTHSVVVYLPETGKHQFTIDELESGILATPIIEKQKIEYLDEDVELVRMDQPSSTEPKITSQSKSNNRKSNKQNRGRRSRSKRK